jgi:hypothetical protein
MRLRHPRFDSRIPLMRVLALMAVVPALLTQAANPAPPNLLNAARTLTKTEIETILSASRQALVAKTFHLAYIPGNQGPDVLMGRTGQPKIIRWTGAIEGGSRRRVSRAWMPPNAAGAVTRCQSKAIAPRR